jgi:gliding motility-associated-like protein
MDTFYRQVVVDPTPAVAVSLSDSLVCAGKEVNVKVTYTREGSEGLRWDMGNGAIINDQENFYHAYSLPGRYTLQLSAAYRRCSDQVLRKEILVSDRPAVELGSDTVICAEEKAFIIETPYKEPGARFQWSSGQNTPAIEISSAGTYVLEVDVNGCRNADTVTITEHTCNCLVNLPNAFTPNNDGKNDMFRAIFPSDCTVKGFAMSIFNRWGQEVFSSDMPGSGWDGQLAGTPAEFGTYSYMARYYIDNSRKEHILKGNFILLR